MKRITIRYYGDWVAVFCLPGIFGVSRATIYRGLKAYSIPTVSLFGIITVVMCRDLYRLYNAKWFKRYIQQLRETGLLNYKPVREDYVTAYAEVPAGIIKSSLHPPNDIITNKLMTISSQQLTDLVDCGLIPTVDIKETTYCLPWWYNYLENEV